MNLVDFIEVTYSEKTVRWLKGGVEINKELYSFRILKAFNNNILIFGRSLLQVWFMILVVRVK